MIDAGEWLLSSWVYIEPTGDVTKSVGYHTDCAIDVDALGASIAFNAVGDELPAVLAPAAALAAIRAEAIEAFEQNPNAPPPAVAPARDRLGRPRVRLRFAGSLSGGSKHASEFDRHCPDWTFASSLREYVLVPHATSSGARRNDPSQPVVGAVFGTTSTVKIVGKQRDKVHEWRSEGLPVPVLWVVDEQRLGATAIDEKVLALRAMLASAGYEADEAPVVSCKAINEASFASLGRALDAHTSTKDVRRQSLAQSPVDRAANLLETAIDEERVEAWPAALARAEALMGSATAEQRSRLVSLAIRCVTDPASHSAILAVIANDTEISD